jgi:hypothetical protein
MTVLADSTNKFYVPPHLRDGGHQHGLRFAVSMDNGDEQSHEHKAHRKLVKVNGEFTWEFGNKEQGDTKPSITPAHEVCGGRDQQWAELNAFWLAREIPKAAEALDDLNTGDTCYTSEETWGFLDAFWRSKEEERAAQQMLWDKLRLMWQSKDEERVAQEELRVALESFWAAKELEHTREAEWEELQDAWEAKETERKEEREELEARFIEWTALRDFWAVTGKENARRAAVIRVAIVDMHESERDRLRYEDGKNVAHPGAYNTFKVLSEGGGGQFQPLLITPDALLEDGLRSFDVVLFPGGSHRQQSLALGREGREMIRQFVADGGGYVGICAGAYLACAGFKCSTSLRLMSASCLMTNTRANPKAGPRACMQPWMRGKGQVELDLTDKGRALFTVEAKEGQEMEGANEAQGLQEGQEAGEDGKIQTRYCDGPMLYHTPDQKIAAVESGRTEGRSTESNSTESKRTESGSESEEEEELSEGEQLARLQAWTRTAGDGEKDADLHQRDPAVHQAFTTLATYRTEVCGWGSVAGEMVGKAAIVHAEYGKGNVLCISPHPEAQANKVRVHRLHSIVRSAVGAAADGCAPSLH